MTGKSLRGFSVFVLPLNTLRDQTELMNYEAISIKYYECLFRSCLSYPACKVRVPYHISISGPCGSTIFFHVSHKRHDIRKKLLNMQCVFLCSLQPLSETIHILRRIQRDIIIKVRRSSREVPVIHVIFQ
jgi:hypothetical protein